MIRRGERNLKTGSDRESVGRLSSQSGQAGLDADRIEGEVAESDGFLSRGGANG